MSTTILLPPATLRQAVAQFKRVYPVHAKTYASQLATARRIVRAGGVRPAEDVQGVNFVRTLAGKKTLIVKDRRCECGQSVCCHRLAVCVAMIGEEIVRTEWMLVSEHIAVLNEEQDPHEDAHSEHGTWNTPRQHVCGDGTVTDVPCSELGEPIVCPHCEQVYCPACDSEVAP